MITGIHHVSMKCGDKDEFQRAKDFYMNTLGLPLKRQWPEGIMIDAGGVLIEIFSNGTGSKEKGAVRHFAFAVTDTDEIAERVTAAGYEVFAAPKDIAIQSDPVCRARIAFCKGPLGEEIEFFCEYR